jgi:toxin ParE1/3/4
VSGQIIKRPRARQDLDEAAAYIQAQRGPRSAIRFLRAAESTLARLAGMPRRGSCYDPEDPLYAGLRYSPVTRHRRFIVFYRPLPDGIEVLRVLHGARDIAGILAGELGAHADAVEDDEIDEPEA